ncbi:MAG: hypothetical protein COZ57_21500, partial [Armatimonadetes bacterium CG_4_8_14_3_um_filter_66_20]
TISFTVGYVPADAQVLSLGGHSLPPVTSNLPPVPVAGASVSAVARYRSVGAYGFAKLQLYLDHTLETPFEGEGATGTLLATYDFQEEENNRTQSGLVPLAWDSTQRSDGDHALTLRAVETRYDQYSSPYEQSSEAHHFDIDIDNTAQDLAPPPVYLEVTNVTDAHVTLSWTPTTISDFDKYEVHKGTTASFTPGAGTLVGNSTDPAKTAFGLGPLQVNTDYYLKIKLYDDGANTSVSNEVHVTTKTTAALFDDPAAGTLFLLGSTVHDAAGQVVARYDANGNGTFYTYDAAGRQTKVTDALGNETDFAYDAAGRKTSQTNALDKTTTYAYDNANRLTSVTDALNHVTSYAYNAAGQQTSVTDALNHTATRTYNSRGRLTAITDPLSNETEFAYDAVGNKTGETNALNQTTSYQYDALNRLVRWWSITARRPGPSASAS